MREITIAGRRIADDTDAFCVAEIGGNHQGSVATCKQIIKAAADAGADAVKLQKRDMAHWAAKDPAGWHREYHSEHAFGRTYGEHRMALEFGADEYAELKAYAEARGLVFFATAFDVPSLRFLVELGVPAIKLASASIVDGELLQACAEAGLPVIASTGGATMREISEAASILEGHVPYAICQCTAEYPCEARDMNLRVITWLRDRYPNTVIGLSDHYNGIALAPVAYVLGARIMERHFTLNRAAKGSDNCFSIEPVGMRKMIRDLHRTREALGDGIKRRLDVEIPALVKMGRADLAVPA